MLDYDPKLINGLELIEPIHLLQPDMPTVILTDNGNEIVARDAFVLGAFDYFTKDLTEFVQREKLLGCIRRAIDMKKATQDFRRMKVIYKTLTEGFGHPIFNVDRQGNTFFLNEAAARQLSKNKKTPDNRVPREQDFDTNCIIPIEAIRRVIDTGTTCVAGFKTTGKGPSHFFEARIHPQKNIDGVVDSALAIAFDVTEHLKTREALLESEERLRCLSEAATEGIMMHRDWVIVDVNNTICKMFGYKREELVGRDVWRLIAPDDREKMMTFSLEECKRAVIVKGIRRNHKDFSCEVTCRPFTYQGTPMRVATFRDITDRQWAEEARRRSEMNFRAVFETAMDPIFIKDSDLRYTHVNKAMEEIFGLPSCEFIGKTNQELFENYLGKHNDEIEQRVLSGQVVSEEHNIPLNGIPFTFNIIRVPLRDNQGSIFGLCGIARDVTERKRMEQELVKRNRELSDFSYRVSHDLKSPLNILKGYLLALEQEPDKQTLFPPRLRKQANRLTAFIDRLLSLSKAGRILQDIKTVPIKALVDNCLLKVSTKTVPVKLITDIQTDSLQGDLDNLGLVFTNLFENSIKYCNPRQENLIITVTAKDAGGDVQIEVKDNGIGIEQKELENIFLPGYALKKDRSTGFGLAIVKKIVEAHDGGITARSDGKNQGQLS